MTHLSDMAALIAAHSIQFTPCEPVQLRFFNRQRREVKRCGSVELLVFGDYTHPYFRTELEYEIAIMRQINTVPDAQYSYVEAWTVNAPMEFICRRYIRGGELSPFPFIGFEPDITKDALAREQQIATEPKLKWAPPGCVWREGGKPWKPIG